MVEEDLCQIRGEGVQHFLEIQDKKSQEWGVENSNSKFYMCIFQQY